MSYNVAATSIGAGLGLTAYGAYKYVTAIQKKVEDASQQRKIGLGLVAVGVAAIAVGVGIIYSGTEEEIANCPINELKDILNVGGSNSMTAQTFNVLNETQGISCKNYLPWQNEFHRGGTGYIDGIQSHNLDKPVMWGIDEWKRPYMAIKYVCDQTKEGVVTLFQRYIDGGSPIVPGGHFQPKCSLGPLDPINTLSTEFFDKLTTLFNGGKVLSQFLDRVFILNLAK